MKTIKSIIIFSLITAFLTACSGESTNEPANSGDSNNNGYSAEETKVAVEQCMQSGASEALCECATKELQALVSADEMKQIEADITAGKAVSPEFAKASGEAAVKCAQAQVQN